MSRPAGDRDQTFPHRLACGASVFAILAAVLAAPQVLAEDGSGKGIAESGWQMRVGGRWSLPGVAASLVPTDLPPATVDVHPSPVARMRLGTRQLPAVIDAAADFSLALRADAERQMALEAQADEARNAFFPRVSAGIEKPLRSRIEYSPDVTQGSDSFPTERPSRVGVEVSLMLFDGMMRINTLRAARSLAAAGRHLSLGNVQQIRLETVTASLAVQRERRRVSLRTEAIRMRREMIAVMNKLFDDRAVTRTEIAMATMKLEEDEAALAIARGDLKAAELEFARLVGQHPPSELSLSPSPRRLPATADQAAERALAGSPTLRFAELEAEAAQYRANAAFADAMPKVELTASAGWEYNTSPLIDRTDEAAIMLRLRVPLVDTTIAPRITRARAEARQKHYEAQDTTRGVGVQARALFEQRHALIGQIDRLNRQIAEAAKAVKGMRIEREAGTRTVLDVLDAEGDLIEARLVLAEAEYERDRAGFQLLALAGELDGESGQ